MSGQAGALAESFRDHGGAVDASSPGDGENDELARLRAENAALKAARASGSPDATETLQLARELLGQPKLQRVVKSGASNAVYDLEMTGGKRIPIGNYDDLLTFRKVRRAIGDAGYGLIPYYGAKEFHEKVGTALDSIVEVEDDSGFTEAEEARTWIASFVADTPTKPVAMDDPEQLATWLDEHSFRGDDDRLYVGLEPLVRHVKQRVGTRVTTREVAARLGRLGFKNRRLSARVGAKVEKGRYWISPPGFDPDEDGE